MSFNPFGKKLSEVVVSDLVVLKEVSEGWYIEYKRQEIKLKDIAKQISAFANQYGGYLFFGIEESQDSNRKAESFPGIDVNIANKLSIGIREATAIHISPEVYYEEKIFSGPCAEIGLDEGKSIIVIDIPASFDPPHIHSSGRIYMRHADQSKPKVLTDRYDYDRLYVRQDKNRKNVSKFFNAIPELPKEQENNPFVYVYITPSPYIPISDKIFSFKEFCSFVKDFPEGFGDHVPMQTIHPVKDGFYARQTMGISPALSSAAIRYWHNKTVRFDIPIRFGTFETINKANNIFKYKFLDQFVDEFLNQGFDDHIICDYSNVTAVLISMCNMYWHMIESLGGGRSFMATFVIKNIFRTIPYMDTEKYINHCSNYGIPVANSNIIKYVEDPYYDNMFLFKCQEKSDGIKPSKVYYTIAGVISLLISQFLGLLADVDEYDECYNCFHLFRDYE